MANFWKEHSHVITKLNLNQFGAAFLGLTISIAAAQSDRILLCASIFASIFYLSLLYMVMWEDGAKERIRIDGGRAAYKPITGLYMSLAANIPNIILAILINVFFIFGSANGAFGYEWAGNIYAVVKPIAIVWQAMYSGVIGLYFPGNPIVFFLIIIPAVAISFLGYFLGLNNFRITGMFRQNKKSK